LDHLAVYDEARGRVQRAEQGLPVEQPVIDFYRLPTKHLVRRPAADRKGATRHRIIRREGALYVVDPPLPEGNRIRIRDLERHLLYDYYRHNPHRMATRAPMAFLGALTVALLGYWIVRVCGVGWLGLLVPAAYATSPEVFVRCGIAGYSTIWNFLMLQILFAADRWSSDRSRDAWMNCMLAGMFAGWTNHKLVLLPAALVIWELLRLGRRLKPGRAAKTLLHPVLIGFVAASAMFWFYALALSPADFWQDHVMTHFIDRIRHNNPFGYTGYPGVWGLWLELWRHTGYVLLPMGIVTLLLGCCLRKDRRRLPGEEEYGLGTPLLWVIFALLLAVAFSVIDWRQTKHLFPLLLVLHLAAARWAASGRLRSIAVGGLFIWLLLWNLGMLHTLATDFAAFRVTPTW